jgi:hypothetical protein
MQLNGGERPLLEELAERCDKRLAIGLGAGHIGPG